MAMAISAAGARRGTLGVATLAIARRTLLKSIRTPMIVLAGTLQGVMFLLIFRYVFGGAIQVGGDISYVNFLIPGYITTGILFTGSQAAVGIAEDVEGGLIDRLRSLPIPRLAPPAGRALADTILTMQGLGTVIIISFIVGFSIETDLGQALLALGLLIVYAFAFVWIFMWLGLVARGPQAAQGLSLLVFPFTFVSSAFVPVESMPNWLEPVAQYQPLTMMVNATRILTQGQPVEQLLGHGAEYYVIGSLAWCAGLVLLFAPLALRRYWRE